MANVRKQQKELKRRYGRLAESMEAYYHHLDLRPLTDLDDAGFAYLMQNVKGTDMLDLDELPITGISIKLLTQTDYVKELRLKGCRHIDDDAIPDLDKINGLELLHVKGTGITIDGLLQLRNQPRLKTLIFSGDDPQALGDKVRQLQALLPQCKLILNGTPLDGPGSD